MEVKNNGFLEVLTKTRPPTMKLPTKALLILFKQFRNVKHK